MSEAANGFGLREQQAEQQAQQGWDAYFRGLIQTNDSMMEICGTWREDETYHALDVVVRDGTCWVAKLSNPGSCPGPGWQLMSQKGSPGKISGVMGTTSALTRVEVG